MRISDWSSDVCSSDLAAHAYGGFMAQLTAWCEEHGVPYSGVLVGEIKKFATSKGNASKGEMIAATQEWGYSPADDNEEDAIAIFHLQQTKNPADRKRVA